MGFEFFRAEPEHDREEIFRFRYTVYVEEPSCGPSSDRTCGPAACG